MNKILSIIIPSYNMEKYLDQCISSLIVESLPKMEIFIVNDGSKDSTLQIANKWSSKYPDSIIVVDKPNGNYGSCINKGLSLATGKYLKVLDADDSFNSDSLDDFISFLEKVESDMVVSNYSIVDESGKETAYNEFWESSLENLKFEDATDILYHPQFQMHAVAYRRDLFSRFSYHQTEGISYTDQEWVFKPIAFAETISFVNLKIYKYLVGREGQTVNRKITTRMAHQLITVLLSMLDAYVEVSNKIDAAHKEFLEVRLLRKSVHPYQMILLKTNEYDKLPLLYQLDKALIEKCPIVYNQLNKIPLKGKFPIRFIDSWRDCVAKKGIDHLPIKIKLLRNIICHFY